MPRSTSTTNDPEFGYRSITDELAGQGVVASRNRVNQLGTQQRLWSVHSRKRGPGRRPGPLLHDDLVLRELTAPAPNLWLTDITEHPTAEGGLYLCAVKDACSNRGTGVIFDRRSSNHAQALRSTTEVWTGKLLGHTWVAVRSQVSRVAGLSAGRRTASSTRSATEKPP